MDITARLFELRDPGYQAFEAKLIPNIAPESVIGVRMPALRSFAKELRGTADAAEFFGKLPHIWLEENTLHGLLAAEIRDPDACIAALDALLPYVDNWATCDVISPVCFKKHPPQLLPKVREWLDSEHVYTIRFGMGTLLGFYLDGAFSPEHMVWVAAVRSEAYYVRMMAAWYFATALAKQPEAALPWIRERRLDPWTHNKTIQKACESYRVPPEMKEELRSLRVKC